MKRTVAALAVAFFASFFVSVAAAEPGLVAHWPFDEGSGNVLHDRSGNRNHGKIKGAKWVRNGNGYALEFDGVDDLVDCGTGSSLNLTEQLTLEAWVYAKPMMAPGEAGIVGKSYGAYVMTQWGGLVWTYVHGGPYSVRSPLALAEWHHVAYSFDGKAIRLYLDGVHVAERKVDVQPREGKNFWMGRSDGDLIYTKDAHFHGRLTDVRVYNRALTPELIARHARTTNRTGAFVISAVPVPWQKKIVVQLDKRGLPRSRDGLVAEVTLVSLDPKGPGARHPLLRTAVTAFDPQGQADIVLPATALPPGAYEIRAGARDSSGKRIGKPSVERIEWAPAPPFPRGPEGARQLNNFVTELLNVPGPVIAEKTYTFINPRTGWLYFSNAAGDKATLKEQNAAAAEEIGFSETYRGAHEIMRFLRAGTYTLTVARARQLIVRAIPRLVYANYGCNPLVKEYGSYRDEFERKYILKNVNTFAGAASEPDAKTCQGLGKRWVVQCSVPKGTAKKPLTVDAAYKFITEHLAFNAPSFNGLIADEFGVSWPYCAPYAKALDKALAEPRFKGKVYWPYAGDLWNGAEGRELVNTLVKNGCAIAWKRYLKTQRTEGAAWRFLQYRLTESAAQYRDRCPGSLAHLVPCFGFFSAPPESLDTFPHVNYKTWLEMQFNLVANDPVFDGGGGLMTYLANFADEEITRWALRLFRHYGIEGRSEMLGADPYVLPHLGNGDFERQHVGWSLLPAERASIRFDTFRGYAWLQGRYPETLEGDTVLVTKRRAGKPNVFMQEIRHLAPGRLYSFRMLVADRNDPPAKVRHAVTVRLDNVNVITDKSFVHLYPNAHLQQKPPHDKLNTAWFNYHWTLFRAESPTARLTISDWAESDAPGGPVDQELMYNFIKVQPYFAD